MTNIPDKFRPAAEAFVRLLQIMDDLRQSCPWDKKQTNQSLRMLTIEETYELADAILQGSPDKIKEELGDLMLHLVFYAKIGSETGDFTITGVINDICEKLIVRHPHIYGDVTVKDDKEVKDNWEKIKLENGSKTTLGGVPAGLPSMVKAIRIQDKASGVGFDWDHKDQVWDKVQEELSEFKEELIKENNEEKKEAEFGDLLFSLINYARFENINPDNALEKTNQKFISRFNKMEKAIKKDSLTFKQMTLDEMEAYWQRMKS